MSEHFQHRCPEAIVDHQASGVLELLWQDGSASRLSHRLLRERCRCAACEQESRRLGHAAPSAAGLRLQAIHPVADRGLNLAFSDGHGRGIYPWAYLHQIAREGTPQPER